MHSKQGWISAAQSTIRRGGFQTRPFCTREDAECAKKDAFAPPRLRVSAREFFFALFALFAVKQNGRVWNPPLHAEWCISDPWLL